MNEELKQQIFNSRSVRTNVTYNSHLMFFSAYFSGYMEYKISDLHRELFAITEQEDNPLAVIMAFRGSAKSTIMTLSYPIWAIVGKQGKKFVLIVSQTQYQARVHMTNIKRELESNELLANDLGPFVEQREEWGSTSLFIPKYNARITAISTEQSVRGIRHGATRPDLIIADDVEDASSVKTSESRNKTFDWYTGEIIPAGDTNTKRIVVGNLLHEDSLLMRLKDKIDQNEIDGTFHSWPLMRGDNCTWPGKFPDKQSITKLKRSIANKIAWEREYMLNLIPSDDQIITRDMIHTYAALPDHLEGQYTQIIVGVDLAISESTKADFTAILTIEVRGTGEDQRLYVRPLPVNKRLSFPATIDQLWQINAYHNSPCFYIEKTGYQASVVQVLQADGLDVKGVSPTTDKRSRLNMITDKIQRGVVLFPESGAEELIAQLVGFGVEKHDDLVDALTLAVIEFTTDQSQPSIIHYGKASDLFRPSPSRRMGSRERISIRLDDWGEATR